MNLNSARLLPQRRRGAEKTRACDATSTRLSREVPAIGKLSFFLCVLCASAVQLVFPA
jgi:hypothetical protein